MRLRCAIAVLLGSAAMASPSISGVYNAGSWLPPGLPNSGVAQGAIFTVTGSGLGPSALVQAQTYPLPTSQGLGGTTVQVKVGSVTETCIMVYTVSSQVAAILPSATPVGNGTLTVTYQGSTGSVAIQVVAGDFGMFTLNEGGTGPAVVTDLSYNPITMVNPAHPGQNLILWGTGLGAVTGDETEPPSPVNFPGVTVLVGTTAASVSYAGRSSSPGLDQINLVVPSGIAGGCKTSIVVAVNGVVGNVVTTSIAPAGQSTCGDPYGALTQANLQKAVANGALNIGAVDTTRYGSANNDVLLGDFAAYPVNSLIRSYAGDFAASPGSCVAYETTGTTIAISDPVFPTLTRLDPGATLTISSSSGRSAQVSALSTGLFDDSSLGTPSNPFLAPGTYTVSNGNGGAQVGAFSWTNTLPSPVTATLPTTITRSQNLTLTWSGGASYSGIAIFGYSGVPLTTGVNAYAFFVCTSLPTTSSFTIPSQILSLLPTNGYAAEEVPGAALQIAGVVVNAFQTTGLDSATLLSFVSSGVNAKVQ